MRAHQTPFSLVRCKPFSPHGLSFILLALFLFLKPLNVFSEGLEDALKLLKPYLLGGITYESNLLLLSSDAQSDFYTTLGFGIGADLVLGQQTISLDGLIYRNDFDRFDYLDFDGGEVDLVWDWIAGRLWSGRVGYRFDQSLRSFAFQLVPFKDIISRNRVFVEADRWVADRWRLGLEGNWTNVGFSESSVQDRTILGGGARIDYVTSTSNTLGLRASYSNGDFQSESIADYYEFQVGPELKWRLSPKTRVQLFLGFLERDYDQGSENDYNGYVGSLSTYWQATGKTSFNLSLLRTVSALGDEIANYAVVHGVTLEPSWAIGSKTILRGLLGYQEQDFRGADLDSLGAESRLDKVTDLELWVDWNPRSAVRLSLGVTLEERDSTRAFQDYRNEALFGQIELGF
ncbi:MULTISPECIES: outer membrane beta-barrel protein [unclassified Thiocapsa]|uniref:outer membrane beta-barrel protein n=1 Tax=unclassified Thiocapsa TaxID=2641286 RepID=UPI0035B1FF91